MMQYLFLLALAVIEFLSLKTWFVCSHLQNRFHFSSLDLHLRINEAVGADKGLPLFMVRVFHNKFIGGVFDTMKYFIEYWDIRFLVSLLSIVGMISFCYGLFTLIKTANKKISSIIIMVLIILPLIEIFLHPPLPFLYKIIVLALSYQLLSLFGMWKFSNIHKGIMYRFGVMLLFLISILWLLFIQKELGYYCVTL